MLSIRFVDLSVEVFL